MGTSNYETALASLFTKTYKIMRLLVFQKWAFTSLIILFAVGLVPQQLTAQSGHKANISSADEFTAKGVGWIEGASISDLAMIDVNKKRFKLYSLLDKPTVVVFFSLNDYNTAKNTSYLKRFYKQYNINIIGITTDEYPNRIRKYMMDNQLDWSNVQDDSKKFIGKSFVQNNQLENAQFVILTPDKKVHKIVPKDKPIGMLGAELQKYFASN